MTLDRLKRLQYIANEIEDLFKRANLLRNRRAQLYMRYEIVPTEKSAVSLPDDLNQLEKDFITIETVLDQRILLLEEKREQVLAFIDSLPPDQCNILRLRYIEGLRWEQISKRVSYTREYCLKIHRKAILRLEEQ